MNLLLADLSNAMFADIICLAILAFFAIFNLVRGFMKQTFKSICSIAAIVLAYFFCDELVNFVNQNWGLDQLLASKILAIFGDNQALIQEITAENINSAITSLGLPGFIADYAVTSITDSALQLYSNIGEYLSNIAAKFILSAAGYFVIFIAAKLVLLIVRKILEALVKLPVLRGIDKFLGLILGIIKGVLTVYVLIFIIDILPFDAITPVKTAISESMIGSFFQEHNLFAEIISWIVASLHI